MTVRIVAAAAIVALAATAGPYASDRPVTVDDLMRLRTIVDVKISPDGQRVAYVVSQPSVDDNAHHATLFVVPAAGGPAIEVADRTQIFTPSLPAPRLQWTPDGQRISFLGVVNSRPQVHVVPPTGGRVEVVTAAPQGVQAYAWAPDGRTLAYTTSTPAPPAPVIHVDALPPPVRLWTKAGNDEARAVTPVEHYVDSFSWMPDGRSLIYSAAPIGGFTAPYYTRLYRLAPGQPPQPLVDRPGMNTSPKVSPDGRRVAFITTNERVGLLAPRGLAVLTLPQQPGPAPAGAIRSYPLGGAWIGEMTWAADSQSLYVLMNEGTFATGVHMFEMPVVRVRIDSGEAGRIVDGPVVNYSISISADGSKIAYRQVEARTMGDVVVRDLTTGRVTTVTNVNPELSTFALGTLEPVSWRSFDGMEIFGLLLVPPNRAQQKLPLLVYCHGGPVGGVTYGIFPQFMHTVAQVDPYPVEAFATAGYAVFFPMPRGGSGYGEEGHRAIIKGWGQSDYRDIMTGVDHLVARGVADPGRLGVLGASYGGFMTNWIVTQTTRFKAASSSASISDLTDLYYLADAAAVMDEYYGKPWENAEDYRRHSPLTYVQNVQTPLLLQHGENDPRVPVVSGRRFYEALKGLGKTVELDVFPRGGHVQYQPAAQRASMQRNLDWFRKWINPE